MSDKEVGNIKVKPLNERVEHKISELKGKLSGMDAAMEDSSSLHYTIRVLESLLKEG